MLFFLFAVGIVVAAVVVALGTYLLQKAFHVNALSLLLLCSTDLAVCFFTEFIL